MRFSDSFLRVRPSRRLLAITIIAYICHAPVYADPIQDLHKLMDSGDFKNALVQTDKMLKTAADSGQLLFIKARIFDKMGKNAKALEIYEQLTRSHPEMPEPFNNLAVHFAENGDFDSAIKTLESAFSGHKSYATTYKNLQSVYERLASEYYRKALDSKAPIEPVQLATLDEMVIPVPVNVQTEILVAANDSAPNILPTITEQPAVETESSIQSNQTNVESTEDAAVAEETETSVAEVIEEEPETTLVLTSEVEQTEVVTDTDPAVEDDIATQPEETAVEQTAITKPSVVAEEIEVAALTEEQSLEQEGTQLPASETDSEVDLQSQSELNTNDIVRDRVNSWAKAWSNQDLDSYLAHYSGSFVPRDNMSLADWKEQRRGRLLWREYIKVELTDMNVDIEGDTASASFIQHYESNTFKGTGKKTLKLKQVNGGWFITQELI